MSSNDSMFGLTGKPNLCSRSSELQVRVHLDAFDGPEVVGEQPQPAFGTQLRIEQLERAGREVAGIGVRLVALALARCFVDADAVRTGHVDFAAHLEQGRRGVRVQPQRQIAHGPRLWVTSSPCSPSPRVAPTVKMPFS